MVLPTHKELIFKGSKKQHQILTQTAYYQAGKIVIQTILPEQPPVALITLNTLGTTCSTSADTYIPIENISNAQSCSFLESRLVSLYGGKAASLVIEYQQRQRSIPYILEKVEKIDIDKEPINHVNKSIMDFPLDAKQEETNSSVSCDTPRASSTNCFASQLLTPTDCFASEGKTKQRSEINVASNFLGRRFSTQRVKKLKINSETSELKSKGLFSNAKQVRLGKTYFAGAGNNIFQSNLGNIEIQTATHLARIMVNYWNFYSLNKTSASFVGSKPQKLADQIEDVKAPYSLFKTYASFSKANQLNSSVSNSGNNKLVNFYPVRTRRAPTASSSSICFASEGKEAGGAFYSLPLGHFPKASPFLTPHLGYNVTSNQNKEGTSIPQPTPTIRYSSINEASSASSSSMLEAGDTVVRSYNPQRSFFTKFSLANEMNARAVVQSNPQELAEQIEDELAVGALESKALFRIRSETSGGFRRNPSYKQKRGLLASHGSFPSSICFAPEAWYTKREYNAKVWGIKLKVKDKTPKRDYINTIEKNLYFAITQSKNSLKICENKNFSSSIRRLSVENIGDYSQLNTNNFQLINSLQFSNLQRDRFYPNWFRLYLPDIEATEFLKNVANYYFSLGLQTLTLPSTKSYSQLLTPQEQQSFTQLIRKPSGACEAEGLGARPFLTFLNKNTLYPKGKKAERTPSTNCFAQASSPTGCSVQEAGCFPIIVPLLASLPEGGKQLRKGKPLRTEFSFASKESKAKELETEFNEGLAQLEVEKQKKVLQNLSASFPEGLAKQVEQDPLANFARPATNIEDVKALLARAKETLRYPKRLAKQDASLLLRIALHEKQDDKGLLSSATNSYGVKKPLFAPQGSEASAFHYGKEQSEMKGLRSSTPPTGLYKLGVPSFTKIAKNQLDPLNVPFSLLLENQIFPLNYNGFSIVEKELLYNGLVNNCFAKAFYLINQNRQLLDFLVDYLLRFQILRQHQILYLFSTLLVSCNKRKVT